jgi:phosphoribosyl-AMP cyclohydrolase
MTSLEEIDFSKLDGLAAVVVQDNSTSEVLMVGFMNEEAYLSTLQTGLVTFYSRSRNKQWVKGESSGHTLQVVSLRTDCDRDAIVVRVNANGPGVCHEGYQSCFFRLRVGDEWITTEQQTFSPEAIYGGAK